MTPAERVECLRKFLTEEARKHHIQHELLIRDLAALDRRQRSDPTLVSDRQVDAMNRRVIGSAAVEANLGSMLAGFPAVTS